LSCYFVVVVDDEDDDDDGDVLVSNEVKFKKTSSNEWLFICNTYKQLCITFALEDISRVKKNSNLASNSMIKYVIFASSLLPENSILNIL